MFQWKCKSGSQLVTENYRTLSDSNDVSHFILCYLLYGVYCVAFFAIYYMVFTV